MDQIILDRSPPVSCSRWGNVRWGPCNIWHPPMVCPSQVAFFFRYILMTCLKIKFHRSVFSLMTLLFIYSSQLQFPRMDLTTRPWQVQQWESKWDMESNLSNCTVLKFNITKSKHPFKSVYSLHGQVLENVNDTKYLDVIFSSDLLTDLNWNKHVNQVTSKSSKRIIPPQNF
jgi:hypothetical protein